MAVKNTKIKTYNVSYDALCQILRNPDFSKCLDAEFKEEAILADKVEFRYVRKTKMTSRYGRNYFVGIRKAGDNTTDVSVTTQSRKVTVLIDTAWEKEVEQVFTFIDVLLKNGA